MQHITFPQQWLSIMEADASAWTAVVRKFRITLHEITFVEEAVLVRVPQEKDATDVVVYMDFHRQMSYDVGNCFLVTNQQTGETTAVDVTYTIDPWSPCGGSYGLVKATGKYDLDALQELTATEATADRDVVQPMDMDWDDLEF